MLAYPGKGERGGSLSGCSSNEDSVRPMKSPQAQVTQGRSPVSLKNGLALVLGHPLGADREKHGLGDTQGVEPGASRCSPGRRSKWCIFTASTSFTGTSRFIISQSDKDVYARVKPSSN